MWPPAAVRRPVAVWSAAAVTHVAHTHSTRKGGVEARAMAIRPGLWWHVGGGGGGGSNGGGGGGGGGDS